MAANDLPFYHGGPGVLSDFCGGGRSFKNVAFAHHLRITDTTLVVDGCEFARWEPGEIVLFSVARTKGLPLPVFDNDCTTMELCESESGTPDTDDNE